MKDKKKLLILIEWFAPGFKAGGPIQSCLNICKALKQDYDIYVLTSNTDHGDSVPYKDVVMNQWVLLETVGVHVFYSEKKKLSYKSIAAIIASVNAHYLYLNLLFSPKFVLFPLWLKYQDKIKSSVILCPRGCLYESALSLKWYKKKPLLFILNLVGFYKGVIFHATNEREKLVINYWFPKSVVLIADNLPDTEQSNFKSCIKIEGSLNCIFIARIVPIKNLLFLLDLLASVKQNIVLTIIGPVEDETYWLCCQKAIAALPETITIKYLGAKKNSELLMLLLQQHLFILPTTGENFGHAIFESFLAGRPVLISNQTPWLKLQQVNAGWDLPLTDSNLFVAVIETAVSWNQQQFDAAAYASWNYANKFINNPSLKNSYLQLFS